MSHSELADVLLSLATESGITTTKTRCMKALHSFQGIETELQVFANIEELLCKLSQVPSYSVGGVQPKEWIDGWLYKWDTPHKPEGLVEHIVSRALDFVTFDGTPIPHVVYDAVTLSGRYGCRCRSYMRPGEYEAPFAFYPESGTLESLTSSSVFKEHLTDIARWFICDALFYNEDRHLNNLVLLYSADSKRLPPLFDMGSSLSFLGMPNYEHYEPDPYLQEQVKWAKDVLEGVRICYNVSAFNNSFDRESVYPKEVVEAYVRRIVLCAGSLYTKELVEVL